MHIGCFFTDGNKSGWLCDAIELSVVVWNVCEAERCGSGSMATHQGGRLGARTDNSGRPIRGRIGGWLQDEEEETRGEEREGQECRGRVDSAYYGKMIGAQELVMIFEVLHKVLQTCSATYCEVKVAVLRAHR